MTPKAREEALESFRDDPEVKIMIASLKCGGVGLVSPLSYADCILTTDDVQEFDYGMPGHMR